MPFTGMQFEKCAACGREVRVWDSGLQQDKLTEDAAIATPDGSFVCPFCGAEQTRSIG